MINSHLGFLYEQIVWPGVLLLARTTFFHGEIVIMKRLMIVFSERQGNIMIIYAQYAIFRTFIGMLSTND